MRATLTAVPGVQQVEVEFEKDLAVVHYHQSKAGAPTDAMIAALEGAGYKSWTVVSERK